MLTVHFQLLRDNENRLKGTQQIRVRKAKSQMASAGTAVTEPCGVTAALQTASIHVQVPARAYVVGRSIC